MSFFTLLLSIYMFSYFETDIYFPRQTPGRAIEMPQVADRLITYLGIEFIFSRALIIFIILRISLSPMLNFVRFVSKYSQTCLKVNIYITNCCL